MSAESTFKKDFGLSREQLASIFHKLGDDIHDNDIHYIMQGTTPTILVESAYSGRGFYWTIKTLRNPFSCGTSTCLQT